jgi:exopolysaccharide biosynthesis protein
MKKILNIIMIIILLTTSLITFTGCGKEEKTAKNETLEDDNTTVQEDEVQEEAYMIEYPDKSEEERQILERMSNNNDYKIIEITGSKYHGYITVIYDSSRLHVTATSQLGKSGEYLVDMKDAKTALFAVNGGGFADANFDGDGGTPVGITISNGKYLTDSSYTGTYGVIGIDKNNKLKLGKYSVSETESMGIRDCVTFGPFLILDGKKQDTSKASAQSRAARTAIAQREDGIIFFLVLDGDRTKGEGATYAEEIEILQKYGAVNAANLDGGTSTCMTVNGTLVNDPTSMSGEHRTREISTAFILTADDSDDSDHAIVESKLN